MGSQVLKLLLTTRNFWLLSPSSSSELLLPSLAMAMVDTGMVDTAEDTVAMVATEDTTTARGLLMLSLRLRLMLSPPPRRARIWILRPWIWTPRLRIRLCFSLRLRTSLLRPWIRIWRLRPWIRPWIRIWWLQKLRQEVR